MKALASILFFMISGLIIAQKTDNYISEVWVADQGDGTYKNPILHSDYSDPDVTRAGDDYYMTASSFNAAPGLPILHSKDLVNWELINYALPKQVPVEHFNTPQHGNGVWAPSIRYHNNEFYILNIWSSWCGPCRDEHPQLMQLSKNSSVKLIGLNYKDNPKNAKKFIDILGNPYSMIIIDENGTISIELGAYGVPETYIINKDKKIIKKFIGPLSEESIEEINLILK